MKEFIYLDTEYITSALAQINQGNISSFVNETTNKVDEQQSDNSQNTNNAHIGIKNIFDFSKANQASNSSIYGTTTSVKELMTKTFDDYSYDILYHYIEEKEVLKTSNYELNAGDYVLLDGDFKMIDLSFISELLNKDFIDMYLKTDSSTFQSNSNRIERRNNTLNRNRQNEQRSFYTQIKKLLTL